MSLFLIRHPEPEVPSSVCYGQTDVDLSPQACRELPVLAQRLRRQLPPEYRVFSSPLKRCRRLAELLHGSPLYDDRLQEMHFGDWEMQSWDTLPRTQLDAWADDPQHFVIPGGESVHDMHQRLESFIREKNLLLRAGEPQVLVTHAGIMKLLFAAALSLPTRQWLNLHFGYGTLETLDWPHE